MSGARKISRRGHLRGAAALFGWAMLATLSTGGTTAQGDPVEVAQDLGDGSAQNWLVYPDGRRVPTGCRYSVATGECIGPGATEEIPAPAPRPLTLSPASLRWSNNWGEIPQYVGVMDNTIREFQQRYPAVRVEKEFLTGNFTEAVLARIAADALGDVVSLGSDLVWAFPDVYVDLAPYLKDQQISLDSLLNSGPYMQDGRVLGVLISAISNLWMGNLSLFQRANIPMPRAGWTWDDARDAFRRLTRSQDNVFGTDLATRNPEMSLIPLVKAAGGDTWSPDHSRVFPQEAPAFEAWQWIVEAHTRDQSAVVFGTDSRLINRDIGPTPWDNQKVATMIRHLGWSGHCIRWKCGFTWDFLPAPVHPRTRQSFTQWWSNGSAVVYAKSRFRDQAAALSLFQLDDTFQVPFNIELRTGVPTVKRLWQHPDFTNPPPDSWRVVAQGMLSAEEWAPFPASREVYPLLWQNLVAATKGEIGIRDSFRKMVDEVNNVLEIFQTYRQR